MWPKLPQKRRFPMKPYFIQQFLRKIHLNSINYPIFLFFYDLFTVYSHFIAEKFVTINYIYIFSLQQTGGSW